MVHRTQLGEVVVDVSKTTAENQYNELKYQGVSHAGDTVAKTMKEDSSYKVFEDEEAAHEDYTIKVFEKKTWRGYVNFQDQRSTCQIL
jgi:predicted DNA-binding WGR domain protein